ncbi:MAG: acyl CoA:acetate/3-ketoacid CoA transferase, partial [Rhodobacteraceae bacterium]|nr:acyl CoA:acetate/3-ketoacid CoA transferase [Paracoccaceae bacterium]
ASSLPHKVHVPGAFVTVVVEAPEQLQTTATQYDPTISGEVNLDIDTLEQIPFDASKVIARRVAQELREGWVVNIGYGISANVPRILIEENRHGAVTWVIEQGAIGGIPLLGFKFGCSANAEAFVPSPNQFSFFQSGGFDASLLSFLQVSADGSVNVSKLKLNPHRTAGAGGFVDITSRAKKIIFSGYFNAGAKLDVREGKLIIEKEGRIAKFVTELDQISFSGKRAQEQGQEITFLTERCVIKLKGKGLVVTEIAPGIDIERDIIDQAEVQLFVDDQLKEMDSRLFHPEPIGLQL